MHYEKFQDGSVKCIEDEIPFEIPKGWEWCRLPTISLNIFAGGDKPEDFTKDKTEKNKIPIYSNGIVNDGLYGFCSLPRVVLPSITISARGTIGHCCIRHTPFTPIIRLITVTPVTGAIIEEYLKLVFDFFLEEGTGTSIPQLTVPNISLKIVPVPPLSEQRKVAQSCEQIFKLLDYIESEKTDINEKILSFKSKILDLAIRGKLVPQDPNDEPASVLLERIRQEKEELIKQGKIKRDKKESVIFKGEDNSYYEKIGEKVTCIDDEIPFEIPERWCWCRLGSLFNHNTGKALNSSVRSGKMLTYITTSNVYWDSFELADLKSMPFLDDEVEKCTASKDDLLVCEGGDIGRTAVWNYDEPIRIQNHIHKLRSYCQLNPYFYQSIFYLYKGMEKIKGNGIGLQTLSSSQLHGILIPLASIGEQNRIVKKLHEIFSYIDNLEASLN